MRAADWDAPSSDDDGFADAVGVGVEKLTRPHYELPAFVGVSAPQASGAPTALVPCSSVGVSNAYRSIVLPAEAGAVVRRVAESVVRPSAPSKRFQPVLDKLTSVDVSMTVPGRKVLAMLTGGASHSHIREKLQVLAAAQHWGTTAWVQSLFTHLCAGLQRKDMRCQACWRCFATDSTTLPLGAVTWSARQRGLGQGVVSTFSSRDAEEVTEANTRGKIHQSIVIFAFLLRYPSGKAVVLACPVVVPLQITDSGKAEVLVSAWEESLEYHMWDEIVKLSEAAYDWMSMDRDSANIRGQRNWAALKDSVSHHRNGCYAHCLWTVAGALFDIVAGLVSGTVSVHLSTRWAAHWKLFTETCEASRRWASMVIPRPSPTSQTQIFSMASSGSVYRMTRVARRA